MGFYLMTATGTTPPKYEHSNIDLAVAEAKRLHEKYNTEVLILEVVGSVKTIQVPVTRPEIEIELTDRYKKDDLLF